MTQMDHLTSKLGAAGLVDMAVTTTSAAQVTIHTEKPAHVTSKLSAAGLDTGSGIIADVKDTNSGKTTPIASSNTSGPSSNSASLHHLGRGQWALIGIVIGLILLSAAASIFFAIKRRQRKYGSVGGRMKPEMLQKEVFNAEMREEEMESLQKQETGLMERQYESGYDDFNSHYDGSDYVPKLANGDKRAQYEG